MYFHFFFFFFCYFLFFFKFFTSNFLIINSKKNSIAFLKTGLYKSYHINLFDNKKIQLEHKKKHDNFGKGKLKKKNHDNNKTKEKKNQNDIKSKKISNKFFKKRYYKRPFKKFYKTTKKDKELKVSKNKDENENKNENVDENEEKKIKEKKVKKRKYINLKKLKEKKKKSEKEEKILNMFQNDLNYSIEKLNKRTRKYEIFKENENLKDNILKNEILQKVFGKNSSNKKENIKKKEKKKVFIDDISDNNNDVNDESKNKRENKKKNNYEKIRLENSGDENSLTEKKKKKETNIKKYPDFKKLNHTNQIHFKTKKKEDLEDRKFMESKDLLISNEKKKNSIKTITKNNNNNNNKTKSGTINNELEKDDKIEKISIQRENNEKTKTNEEEINYEMRNKNKDRKINKEKLANEKMNIENITEEKMNNEKNKSNIDIQSILKIGDSIDNFRKEIIILDNKNKEYNNIKSKLIKFNSIIDLNANKYTEKKKKINSNKICNFKDIGIFDNFINVYLKYNKIKTATEYQRKYIPMILFFMNNTYFDLRNCYNYIKDKKSSTTKNTNFLFSRNSTSNFLEIQNSDNQMIKNKEISYQNIKKEKEKEMKIEDKKEMIEDKKEMIEDKKEMIEDKVEMIEDKVENNYITNDINNNNKIEQIIYVNKYNDLSKKFIRTFFLHCPTGTGKTFIYLLPIFQSISNFSFLEYEMNYLIKNEKYLNSILFDENKLFYENKSINENLTSFFCVDKLKDNFFDEYNLQRMNNIYKCLINKKKKKVVDQDNSLKNEIINYNHKVNKWIDKNINDLKIRKKNDILILTYNKELAVQIYELYKDIINSFYKSFNSNFFKNNDSLIFSNLIEKEEQSIIEKINVNFKKKININAYLLIGGNNIKYQLKSLKKKKINITSENADSINNSSIDNNTSNDCNESNKNHNNKFFNEIQNINIYIGTPGRLDKLIHERKIIKLKNISTVIFDEYDFFFNSFKNSDDKSSCQKIKLENIYFSKLLKSIYLNNKEENKLNNIKKISYTNVICCSATSAVYSYLTYTKHIITTNFLQNLRYKISENTLERSNLLNNSIVNQKDNWEINNENKNEMIDKKSKIEINNENKNELINEDNAIQNKDGELKKHISSINYKNERNMLNELFKINEIAKIPENLIHLNYYYDIRKKKKNNNAISNFLRILFSNPLNKNVLVFCNTKKKVMDIWSLFKNRFDVDIQTIFCDKEKQKKKKIFKDINYANFFKNDLIDYKNLKKYVNFLFISTNLLYRGINCMGFTTVVNFDMPLNSTEYVHRCGRIGRINNKGTIINIFEKKYKRKYYKEIFNKLNLNVFDIDCYMNHMFTLKSEKN
ncbi:ATP-dependent RNA helicase, putative [Plasmodium relictum]|uniref:ATP-dependent RNA helicase, putative n=1 Tax=Plasmodium relictum TaxID=85471 RepID=A0A1J1HDF7_PLARL|nr:ATP-dependent RNA helicase, putative [Plasmodium relictum]CRH03110.1 ATP-dependent RNA helicase, putative [Plasmodium relictum]